MIDTLVSIIIPIYKAEKYLSKCLDSILSQTITDFELLLINDGSPDNSGKICEQYAIKDSRIKVFHKNNGGVSSARNLGLDNAAGKWVAFIDSDDWIEATYLENLLSDNYDVDFRIAGYVRDKFNKSVTYIPKSDVFFNDRLQFFYERHLFSYLCYTPWGKLFQLKFINNNNLRFNNELSFGEDTLFNVKYIKHINSVYIKNFAQYHCQYVPNSLSTRFDMNEKELFFSLYKEELMEVSKKYKYSNIIKKLWPKMQLSLCIYRIKNLYLNDLKKSERIKKLSEIFSLTESYKFSYWKQQETKSKIGFLAILFYHISNVYIADVMFKFLLKIDNNV